MKIFTSRFHWGLFGGLTVAAALALAAPVAANAVTLTKISNDPFQNTTSQHQTEVEPDTFASGSTVVSAFQVGRFFNGGSSDIGWATSGDGGATWTHGFLPGLTFSSGLGGTTGAPYQRVSDPSVAYDAKLGVWLVSSIPLESNLVVPKVFINTSTDATGTSWNDPVSIQPPVANKVNLDKNWTVCDNHSVNDPFYGNCYTEFDNFGQGDLEYMSTSTDGGQTWSDPVPTAGNDKGLGGQPVVQPDGTVIVPFESLNGKEAAFESTDGGQTWARANTISSIRFAPVAGGLRTSPLPTAEIDGSGKVYVAWEDCRFRKNCSSNDIVFSSSTDGVNWSPVQRVPIDGVNSGADHFIPGLAVDQSSSDLALTYYFYPNANCSTDCNLEVGFISSRSGGAHWSDPQTLQDGMSLSDIANTSQGPMVGDYISTSFTGSDTATTVFAVGNPHTPAQQFDEAMYSPGSLTLPPDNALRVARSSGVKVATGQGTGSAHQAVRRN